MQIHNLAEEMMSESNMIAGGWTPFSCDISEEDTGIFNAAIGSLLGVQYTPVAMATQVVSGINYCFFCNAKAVYPNAPNQAATVTIYAPPSSTPHVTGIKMINGL